ncbi:hypothetical protein FHW79_004814 [Azospirillum sp. OGB3]|uniref:hypothetical protein n=1 Tax=Azospirillum sp. OGB3 TaxID=2587012 RepID=UPI0017EA0B61|nr:hypothetical protein [Azospirillum sp. OGB3]MBB3267162.1 hypothetical protein [Azospirillum sp. OGB3]
MRHAALAGLTLAAGLLTAVGTARAQDDERMALSSELPVTVEDAAAIEKGSVDVKVRAFFDRLKGDGGRNRLTFDPELQVGVADGLALKANPGYRVGNADDAQQGDVKLSAEYNILAPSQGRLGLSVEPLVSIPYGSGSKTTEAGITGRLTQPLGTAASAPRLHANLSWRHRFDPEPGERDNRFIMAAGMNAPVGPATAVAFDVVREQSPERGKADNFVEAGVRHLVGEDLAVGAGIGVGFGPDSPRYRLLLGVQRSF